MGIGGVGTSLSTTRCLLKWFSAHTQISQAFDQLTQIKLNLADANLRLLYTQAFHEAEEKRNM